MNSSAGWLSALSPTGVVTVTSTVPAPAGAETAVTEVAEVTVKLAAAAGPKLAPVAALNPVPVMVTEVPPARGPDTGVMALTAGRAS